MLCFFHSHLYARNNKWNISPASRLKIFYDTTTTGSDSLASMLISCDLLLLKTSPRLSLAKHLDLVFTSTPALIVTAAKKYHTPVNPASVHPVAKPLLMLGLLLPNLNQQEEFW